MPYTRISENDELNMIRDNYENRLSFNQIQKKYHVSAQRITKIFAKGKLKNKISVLSKLKTEILQIFNYAT